ncbi:MAG: hypothetical protein PHZ04_02750 [Patescibacteria group bacterium]|nr:hypothetical protein [Patescibacteria group bacterium]MDD5294867.1 hypothetical protein [Patescibacteria group bacterium]MDD5554611.1 hypothetical protein [Patescibacteria group bacterium]
MGDIINFDEARQRAIEQMDLSGLIARAVDLREDFVEEIGNGMLVVNEQKLEIIFERVISDILLTRRLFAPGFFICGRYIAVLLRKISFSVPESWFAVDYFIKGIEEGNPILIKQGADICFLFCSVFPERSNHRNMTPEAYKQIGAGLYYSFFLNTGGDIGRFMARGFDIMADVTRQCLLSLQ